MMLALVILLFCAGSFGLGAAWRGIETASLRRKNATLRRWYVELDREYEEQGRKLCEEAFARDMAEQTAVGWRNRCAQLEHLMGLRPQQERQKYEVN